ncbi:hypothetical protein AAF712_015069 [Marasmius tenuissimus]|uniref:Uncharacterized protein n=1 Tax=Marasmius tenuissimus TaxID=585030 RepID=A0ABR2ZBT9_9AGAR
MTSRTTSSLPRPRTKSAVVPPTFTPSSSTSPAFRPTLPSALLASHNASSKFTQLPPSLTFSASNTSPSNTTSSTNTERSGSSGGSKLRKPSCAARIREKASTKKGEEEQRPLQKQISAPLFRPRGPSLDGAEDTTRSGSLSKPGDSQQGGTSRLSSIQRRPVPSLIDDNETSTGDPATSPIPSANSTISPRPRTNVNDSATSDVYCWSQYWLLTTNVTSTETYFENLFRSSTNRPFLHFFNAVSCEAAYTVYNNEDQYPQDVSCTLNSRFSYFDGLNFLHFLTSNVGSFSETTNQVTSTTLYSPTHTISEKCRHFAVTFLYYFFPTSGTVISFSPIPSFDTFCTEIESARRTFHIGQAGIHKFDFNRCWFVNVEKTYSAFITTRYSGAEDTWTTTTYDGEQNTRNTYINSPKAVIQPEQLYGI